MIVDRAELRAEHLHRDLPVVADVVREVDGRHPPGTELPLDPVAIGEGGRQAFGAWVHREGILVGRGGQREGSLTLAGIGVPPGADAGGWGNYVLWGAALGG